MFSGGSKGNIGEKWVNKFAGPGLHLPEAVVQRCSVKKVFLQISQNLQENTCATDSFLIKFQA